MKLSEEEIGQMQFDVENDARGDKCSDSSKGTTESQSYNSGPSDGS